MTRQPTANAARYVHPRANRTGTAGEHAYGLEILEDSSPNYQRWIADLCRPYLGTRAVEIGAGRGAVARFLAVGVPDYAATDIDAECLNALSDRFADSANVRVFEYDINVGELDGLYDAIILINVLEHIYDDEEVLRKLSGSLSPNGHLILYVPAFNWLYGSWDRKIGHFRRYSAQRVAAVADQAGLDVVKVRYVNFLAIPAWFAFSRLGVRQHVRGQESGPRNELALWDRTAVPLMRRIEDRAELPFGLNVLCVAKKRLSE